MTPDNEPRILVEFDEEEAKWLADLLHNRYFQMAAMKANWSDHPANVAKAEADQKKARDIKSRIEENASKQGFGDI